jgi:hypothetical protein
LDIEYEFISAVSVICERSHQIPILMPESQPEYKKELFSSQTKQQLHLKNLITQCKMSTNHQSIMGTIFIED